MRAMNNSNDNDPPEAPIRDLAAFRHTTGSDPSMVPCRGCNVLINMFVIKCPHCGLNFSGPAFQFAPDWNPASSTFFPWRAVACVAGVLALIAVAILLFGLFVI